MMPRRTLSILVGAGLLSLGLSPMAMAHDSPTQSDNSGSISNLVANYPDVYPQRFVKFNESSYTYEITFMDNIDTFKNQNCILSLNNVPIKNDTCAVVITKVVDPAIGDLPLPGVVESSADGSYVLTANGSILVSWTFKRSPELPPKPSECVINSVKPVSVKNKVVSITILDNGRCKGGLWYYTYSRDSTKKPRVITALGKNSYGMSKGVPLLITKGSTVIVTYESGDLFDTTLQKKFAIK